jgi:hypothetical protein
MVMAGQNENIDAGRVQLADELGTPDGVHLEMKVGHDLHAVT